MDKWQPIETAPKDGTEILGWVYGERWAVCKYHKNSMFKVEGFATYGWDDGYEWADPTHWMPLPDPPTT